MCSEKQTLYQLQYRWSVSRARDSYGYNVCTLWVNGEKVTRCNGGGYDMQGTCLGNWIAREFAERLCRTIQKEMYGLRFVDPAFDPGQALVPGTSQTVAQQEQAGESFGLERLRAAYAATSPLPTPQHSMPLLDGGCGKESMIAVLQALGGSYQNTGKHLAIVVMPAADLSSRGAR